MVDQKQHKKRGCNCDDKSITYQIAMGVILTLVIIFLLLVLVISLNVYFLNHQTEQRIYDQLEGIYCNNLQDLGNEGAASIDVIRQITYKLLVKVENITTDIINPQEKWKNSDGVGVYPLDHTKAQVNKQPHPFKLTFNNLTKTNNYTDIGKRLTILQNIWKSSLQLKMGPDRKIQLSYIVFYFPQQKWLFVQGQRQKFDNKTNLTQELKQPPNGKKFLKMLKDPFSNSKDYIVGMAKKFKTINQHGNKTYQIVVAAFYKRQAFDSMIKILEGDVEDDELEEKNKNRNLQVLLFQKSLFPSQSSLVAKLTKSQNGITKSLCQANQTEVNCTKKLMDFFNQTAEISQETCKINKTIFESDDKQKYYVARKTSPYNTTFNSSNDDFQLLLFQNKKELDDQLDGLVKKIRSDTVLLTSLVLLVCLIVLALIGFFVIRYSRRISNPIQVLNKVVENIKKQSNRDDFYQLLRSQKIFERFQKAQENDQPKNYDEIDRLISIFYKFFVGVKQQARGQNQRDQDGPRDRLFVTKYKYYPNLYYNNINEQDDREQQFRNQGSQKLDEEKEEEEEEKTRRFEEEYEGDFYQESKSRNIHNMNEYMDDSQNLLQNQSKRQDSAKKLMLPREGGGGSVQMQEIDRSQTQHRKDNEKEREFDYAEDIEKTKKLIKKLTKSHKPINIDWDDLLKNVKDIENQNNRQIQNS